MPTKPDLPPDEQPRPFTPGAMLDYSNHPAPEHSDTAVMDFLHGVSTMVLYLGAIAAMKYAAIRWRWELGAICGVWLAILVVTAGFAVWLYGAFGWRGVMAGALLAILGSLFAAPLILGG